MSWAKRISRTIEPMLMVYSNRPPFEQSGGALQVINATGPDVWVGPNDVADDAFLNAQDALATTTHTHNKNGVPFPYSIVTGNTPDTLQHDQYNTISNSLLWAIYHSKKPNTGEMTIKEIENAYFNGYLAYNQLGQHALEKTAQERRFDESKGDYVWVHDYQCDNVPGQIYSRHIPFPTLSFLASGEASFPTGNGNERVNILETAFFRDLMENATTRTLSTFQRPVDQVNFLMTAAYMQSQTQGASPLKVVEPEGLSAILADIGKPEKWAEIQSSLLEKISMGSMVTVEMFGERTSIMNMPVGQNPEETLAKGKNVGYSLFRQPLDPAMFAVDMGNNETVNPTHLNPADYPNGVDMETFIDTLNTSKWVLSVHRNDYTKGTTTKLEAAEKVLAEHKAQGRNDTTFLFILQPTREGVPGYEEYAHKVYRKVAELKAEYGEQSVVVIPQGVSHDAILHLERREEIRGFMGLGDKDGHDLTVREVVDVNSDRTRPIGVITSSGIGASDVLGQDAEGNKGSFVINNPTDAHEVADALSTILDDAKNAELNARFEVMKNQSQTYSAKHFGEEVKKAYKTAQELKHAQSRIPQGRKGDVTHETPLPQRRAAYMQDIVAGLRSRSGGQSR